MIVMMVVDGWMVVCLVVVPVIKFVVVCEKERYDGGVSV